jgi:hypothetical protein
MILPKQEKGWYMVVKYDKMLSKKIKCESKKEIMKKKLKAVKITFIYYGVGLTKEKALNDAWYEIYNDRNYKLAKIDEIDCDLDETSFDQTYIDSILESTGE